MNISRNVQGSALDLENINQLAPSARICIWGKSCILGEDGSGHRGDREDEEGLGYYSYVAKVHVYRQHLVFKE